MTTRTQLDAIIAEHMDPTSTAQFEAAERMVQAAFELGQQTDASIRQNDLTPCQSMREADVYASNVTADLNSYIDRLEAAIFMLHANRQEIGHLLYAVTRTQMDDLVAAVGFKEAS